VSIPDEDLAAVHAWCDLHAPDRGERRLETRVRGANLTILESRPPWTGHADDPWTSIAIAQLRRDPDGRWTLHWQDSRDRWHRVEELPLVDRAQALLAVIERDADGIFWG
jgi:hypothetical protein